MSSTKDSKKGGNPIRWFVAGFLAGTIIIALVDKEPLLDLLEGFTVFKKQQPEGNSN